jgi:hypothetical protein
MACAPHGRRIRGTNDDRGSTPTGSGTYTFTVQFQENFEGAGNVATQSYTITIH